MLTPAAPAPSRAWTVLLYSAGDNDQKPYHVMNVAELETVGSDASTALVAQVDTGDRCDRYLLEKAASPDLSRIQSPALQSLGPVDMSRADTLADFVAWGVERYPAEHYLVIVSDHGSGWEGAVQDDSHGGWMTMPSMREAFEKAKERTGRDIDIVGFDACLMASTEVAHELKDVCRFVVGSEDYEDSGGWPYVRVFGPQSLQAMHRLQSARIDLTPEVLATTIVEEAKTRPEVLPSMTAVDTSRMTAVAEAFTALAGAIRGSTDPEAMAQMRRCAESAYPFDAYHDAGDLLARLSADAEVPDVVRSAASQATTALSDAIIAEQHAPQHTGAHGLNIQAGSAGAPEGYGDTRFARETGWDHALEALKTPAAAAAH